MFAHYIHAFLLIHFTYSVAWRHAKVRDVFLGFVGIGWYGMLRERRGLKTNAKITRVSSAVESVQTFKL